MHFISYNILIAGLFALSSVSSQTLPVNQSAYFISPLDIPLLLSSNYGEYRSGHFHAGLDFKTQQTEGKNVFAVDSGYVYRVVVLEGSYGNAVYIKHPSGFITLYGHLSKFEPLLANYVKEQQYRKKSFTVDLLLSPEKFVFRKGDFVGLSGNSGSSFGAHLHFEVRDSTGAVPLNPLNFGFAVKDKISPNVNFLKIYPFGPDSYINGANKELILPTVGRNNSYSVRPDTIPVSGMFGLGIESFDFLDNASNECGPYTIQMLIDNNETYFSRIDSIPFSAAGYINSYFDYGEMVYSGKKIQKLFIDPNNKLGIYKVARDRGMIRFNDESVHIVRIIVTDTYGNESVLNLHLKSSPLSDAQNAVDRDSMAVAHFACDSLNVYEKPDFRIAIPENALFTNIDFQYQQTENDSVPYSFIYHVHNRYTPLLYSCMLSIKPRNLPELLQSKALIARRNEEGTWIAEGGEYKNGFISARVRSFGQFIVSIDTISPVIKTVEFTSGAKYNDDQMITFSISDSLSGIRKYAGFIDKKWALFEYDAKNGLLSYSMDKFRLEKDRNHQLEIFITDNKGNFARFKDTFYY